MSPPEMEEDMGRRVVLAAKALTTGSIQARLQVGY
jgi:hypothetical protein